jgi:hypothetical protein
VGQARRRASDDLIENHERSLIAEMMRERYAIWLRTSSSRLIMSAA